MVHARLPTRRVKSNPLAIRQYCAVASAGASRPMSLRVSVETCQAHDFSQNRVYLVNPLISENRIRNKNVSRMLVAHPPRTSVRARARAYRCMSSPRADRLVDGRLYLEALSVFFWLAMCFVYGYYGCAPFPQAALTQALPLWQVMSI